jgi:hypothetical protein
MMNTIDTLKLALEVLEQLRTPLRVNTSLDAYDVGRAIAAIKQALNTATPLAAPTVQEPLGFMHAGNILELQQGRLPYGYVYPNGETGASVAVYTAAQPAPEKGQP